MRILVTGASGFVGRIVCRYLLDGGHKVVAVSRTPDLDVGADCNVVAVGEIDANTSWTDALKDVDGVIHLAARTHRDQSLDTIDAYRSINVDGTAQLARSAMAVGVESFVFMSSIKVNGESSPLNDNGEPRRVSGKDAPRATSFYGRSKLEAEQVLREVFADSPVRVVILRPPLVYGVGQKGNLRSLMRAIDRGVPLPFGNVNNKRSLISVNNLASAAVKVLDDKTMRSGTYTLSDTEMSTADLVRSIAHAMGRKPRLFSFPLSVLERFAQLLGRSEQLSKATRSLIVDRSQFGEDFGWVPDLDFDNTWYEIAESLRSKPIK